MESIQRRSDCPIGHVLDIFGDRWTLLIVRDMMFKGKHGFGAFMEAGEKIASNILTARLQRLEEAGIALKIINPAKKSSFIYVLTEKGIDTLPMMIEMILWSAVHDPLTAATPEFVAAARTDRAGLEHEIRSTLLQKLADARKLA